MLWLLGQATGHHPVRPRRRWSPRRSCSPTGGAVTGQPIRPVARCSQPPIAASSWRRCGRTGGWPQAVADYHYCFNRAQALAQLRARGSDDAALRSGQAAAAAQLRQAELARSAPSTSWPACCDCPSGASLPLPADRPHVGPYRTHVQRTLRHANAARAGRDSEKPLPLERNDDRRSGDGGPAADDWRAAVIGGLPDRPRQRRRRHRVRPAAARPAAGLHPRGVRLQSRHRRLRPDGHVAPPETVPQTLLDGPHRPAQPAAVPSPPVPERPVQAAGATEPIPCARPRRRDSTSRPRPTAVENEATPPAPGRLVEAINQAPTPRRANRGRASRPRAPPPATAGTAGRTSRPCLAARRLPGKPADIPDVQLEPTAPASDGPSLPPERGREQTGHVAVRRPRRCIRPWCTATPAVRAQAVDRRAPLGPIAARGNRQADEPGRLPAARRGRRSPGDDRGLLARAAAGRRVSSARPAGRVARRSCARGAGTPQRAVGRGGDAAAACGATGRAGGHARGPRGAGRGPICLGAADRRDGRRGLAAGFHRSALGQLPVEARRPAARPWSSRGRSAAWRRRSPPWAKACSSTPRPWSRPTPPAWPPPRSTAPAERPIDQAIEGVAAQTEQTLAVLDTLTDYNRAIAEYVLTVLPPATPANRLVAALVVKP